MLKEDCFFLGHISKVHGLAGHVVAALDTDQPERYANLDSVFLDIRGELIPYFIEDINPLKKDQFTVRFEDTDLEKAQLLVGCELFLPLSSLPPLSGKSFYYHEVEGFSVLDKTQGLLGICQYVNDHAPQPLFVILNELNQEILAPAIDEFIEEINREKQEIHLNLPEGLLDLYLGESGNS